jgi:cell division protein YceG involved in septum cleavage
LYPDSYKIKYPIQINKLVIKQLDNFEQKVYNKILSEKSTDEIIKIVNLASIVEKEEKSNSEKPTVAGILKKRLENNWNI